MNRMKGILAAGTLTGLVIITVLALGFGSLGAVSDSGTAVPEETFELPLPQPTDDNNDEALQAWQQYSAELEQIVRSMKDRENTYLSQTDLANQTILQLQDQLNAVDSSSSNIGAFTDDGGHEEHERNEGHEDRD